MIDCPLTGDATPLYGKRTLDAGLRAAPGRHGEPGGSAAFGPDSRLRLAVPYFPERDYTAMAWACPEVLPSGGGQIFCAWSRGMDDPLRLIVVGNEVFARIEAGSFYSTPGAPLKPGVWVHVAAVKRGGVLTLYVDGKATGTAAVPERVHSESREVGIGFNPFFSGGEHFVGRIAGVRFYARAMSAEEVARAARAE
jgi:hypothetical protein